jgi:hypothetical protein
MAFIGLSTGECSAQTFSQLTDIPTVYINTFGGVAVTSKEDYVYCKLRYVENGKVTLYDSTQVRGRGNSTWTGVTSGKRPYRIKFLKKQKFLGDNFAKAKSWTLLANAGDKSMIRNALTYDLGKRMGLEFCPAAKFVDFYLNDVYYGTYQISDQIQVDTKRVPVNADTGYLLEYAKAADKSEEPHFQISYGWMDIKNPEDENLTTERTTAIKDYISDFDTRIHSSDFCDPRKGYRALVDTASLINWYVASEITGNWDMLYSVYTFKEADGKLHFGPLWDEDLGWNNNNEQDLKSKLVGLTNTYNNDRPLSELTTKAWKDPWFADAVTKRLNSLLNGDLETYLKQHVDSLAKAIDQSQQKNYANGRNHLSQSDLSGYDRYYSYSAYSQYISQLKTFIADHLSYLKSVFVSKNTNNRYFDENTLNKVNAESNVNVVLRYTATAKEWSGLCLPFALSSTDLKTLYGEGTKVAEFTGVDGQKLNFTSVTATEAGKPYLVCPALSVEEPFSFQSVSLTTQPIAVTHGGYTYGGSFNASSSALAFRASFTESTAGMDIIVDGVSTGISSPRIQTENNHTSTYTLTGMKVNGTHLPAGVYIRDGKKIIIK